MDYNSHKKHVVDFLFPFSLLFVFVVTALMVVILAANSYHEITSQTDYNNESRTVLAYIAEKVHQNDIENGVSIGLFDGCDSIILEQDNDGQKYYTYIYEDDGMLRELFLQKGTDASAADGRGIMEVKNLQMEQMQTGMFHFSCELGNGRTMSTVVSTLSR